MTRSPTPLLAAALLCVTLTSGCSYNKSSDPFVKAYTAGQYVEAARIVTKTTGTVDKPGVPLEKQCKVDDSDRVLFRLEQGAILRANGQLDQSNLAFLDAQRQIEVFDQQARIKLTQEGISLLTDQTFLDYRGQMCDRVMLSTYRALNYLEAGRVNEARPELIAAYERQQDTEARFAEEIEAQKKKLDKEARKNGANAQRTERDPNTQAKLRNAYGNLDAMADGEGAARQGFDNPFAEYMQGLYFLHAAVDASDLTRGLTALRRTAALVPNNAYVAQDLQSAADVTNSGRPANLTYVIFETGLAPERREIRIDLPIFLVNVAAYDTGVDYVGVSFPVLNPQGNYLQSAMVEANGQAVPTQLVANMDGIVAREFKTELPTLIAKSIASAAIKAGAAYAANRATQQNGWANLLTRIGTTVYQAATNNADLRTWRTLPKQFQVARIPTPANRSITVRFPNGGSVVVPLGPGNINVVHVKTPSTMAPPVVHQYKLN